MKLKVRELKDGETQFISLVEAGANRAPFRVLKRAELNQTGDQDMPGIDLGRAFLVKDATVPPIALAAFVMKQETEAATLKALAAKGFDVTKKHTADGVTVVAQGSIDPKSCFKVEKGVTQLAIKNAALFRVNDDCVMAVSGGMVQKSLGDMSYNCTDFREMLALEGTFPLVGTALNALNSTVYNIIRKNIEAIVDGNKTAEAVVPIIKSAMGDCAGYIGALISMLPASVMKADSVVFPNAGEDETRTENATAGQATAEGAAAGDAAAAGAGAAAVIKDGTTGDAAAGSAAASGGDSAAAGTTTAKADGEGAGAGAGAAAAAEGAGSVPDKTVKDDATGAGAGGDGGAALAAMIAKAVGEAIAPVAAMVTAVKTDLTTKIDAVAKDAAGAKSKAEKTETALKSNLAVTVAPTVEVPSPAVRKGAAIDMVLNYDSARMPALK